MQFPVNPARSFRAPGSGLDARARNALRGGVSAYAGQRVASAVGEGSIAIQMVHEYLSSTPRAGRSSSTQVGSFSY